MLEYLEVSKMIVFPKSLATWASKSLLCAGLAVLACAAQANGESKVYGSMFAWNNDFNKGTVNITFGTGTTSNFTVTQNESAYNLYGYPANIRGWHYGFNPANDTLFPKQMSATNHVTCTFN